MDLDLGNYERFLDITLTKDNNITTGKIYQVSGMNSAFTLVFLTYQLLEMLKLIWNNLVLSLLITNLTNLIVLQQVINRERRGDYLGKTVQVSSDSVYISLFGTASGRFHVDLCPFV